MSTSPNRLKKRQQAKETLASLLETANSVIIIHYSCESFYDRSDGSSPRVTSIAVRNLGTGQTTSFSIHQVAERDGVPVADITGKFDDLEKKMLKEFYQYVKSHQNHTWLHWNMRDITYGFAALAHRSRVLGTRPEDIPEARRVDLSPLLIAFFGDAYIGHPRLQTLIERNSITKRDFLTGEEEANAFTSGEYVKLHLSTLRKVDVLANIVGRLGNDTLNTDARRNGVYGGHLPFFVAWSQEHWIAAVIMIVGSLASIAGVLLYLSG